MAHEELKALYEIDKQNSYKPWRFWQIYCSGAWRDLPGCPPLWHKEVRYRRKPDAPDWVKSLHDAVVESMENTAEQFRELAEDARKWRELTVFVKNPNEENSIRSKIGQLNKPQPVLIQGYTAEQWQTIIDGEFLCEFSDADWHIENDYADRIVQVLTGVTDGRFTGNDYHWPYCRPLRIKGVRQPWFGGERPVGREVYVHATYDNAAIVYGPARDMGWPRVVEFIEL